MLTDFREEGIGVFERKFLEPLTYYCVPLTVLIDVTVSLPGKIVEKRETQLFYYLY